MKNELTIVLKISFPQFRMKSVEKKGKIELSTVPEIFRDLYVEGKTGICTFKRGEIIKYIYFLMGMPVFAASSDPNDKTGHVLMRMKKITPEELDFALAESRAQNKKLCTLLVEKGKLTPDEVIEVVLNQVENIILSVFEWEEGEYEFREEEYQDEDIITLNMSAANIVMEGIRRKFNLKRVVKILGSPWNVYKISDDPKYRFRELRLKPHETRIISAVDGRKNLIEIQEEIGVEDEPFLKAVCGFHLLKLFEKIGEKKSDRLPQIWKELVEEKKEISAEEYYNMGLDYFQNKEFYKARDMLEKAVELDPENAEYYTFLGMCYAASSEDYEANYQAALKAFRKAAELNPDDPRNFYYAGVIYMTLGKNDIAKKAFEKVLEINPEHAGARKKLRELEEEEE